MKIAINGFGRIGRTFYRLAAEKTDLEVVAINDLSPLENLEYLLKYDSVYGRWDKDLAGVKCLSQEDPAKLPWKDLAVDVVIESTGHFTDYQGASKHRTAGAKKVIISAIGEGDISIILGVNQDSYNPDQHHIISNGSCTTNCAAPVIKVLYDNLGIINAQLVTVHAVTATQSIVDSVNERKPRRGRAAFESIVPSSTGAGKGTLAVIPELEGRLSAFAFRVPILCGSVIELIVQTEKETTTKEVNNLFERQADNKLKGILEVTKDELVSADIVGTSASAIVDTSLTEVLTNEGSSLVRMVAWYDNEWAYSCRLADLCQLIVT